MGDNSSPINFIILLFNSCLVCSVSVLILSVKSDLRHQEIEEFKEAKERVRMKRLGKK